MTDPVGTPLAALATAERCVKLAVYLHDKFKDYKSAEYDIQELILKLDYHALTIEHQIAFLRSIWSSVESRLQNLQNTLIHNLYHKLQYAVELVDAAIGTKQSHPSLQSVSSKPGPIRKLYFAFSLKKTLLKTVRELEEWHQMFDPTWYLISRVSDQVLDLSLDSARKTQAKSITVLRNLRKASDKRHEAKLENNRLLMSGTVEPINDTLLPGTSICQGRFTNGDVILIDRLVPNERASLDKVRDEINRLTLTLAAVDPDIFGLLQCCGVRQREGNKPSLIREYELFFKTPSKLSNPSSLRERLCQTERVSLNVRLSLARSLSNAVMFVHSAQFVHKNIRPETIVTFASAESPFPQPFLLGFEKFRTLSGETFKTGDLHWERDMYRHPTRQGLWPEEEYDMLHDIYSLGVILLEIGLWTSFVRYSADGAASLGLNLSFLANDQWRDVRKRSAHVKDFFVQLAREQLPSSMGDTYAEIVVSCLTCMDVVNPGLGDVSELLDADDIVVGVEFAENVIMKLHDISY